MFSAKIDFKPHTPRSLPYFIGFISKICLCAHQDSQIADVVKVITERIPLLKINLSLILSLYRFLSQKDPWAISERQGAKGSHKKIYPEVIESEINKFYSESLSRIW